ncbi:MAG: 1,4-alpha-glucan branching enzyme, partial [Nitrosomonadales bacterium]
LLFMGSEFGQKREWQHEASLEWHVLQYPLHEGIQRWVADLNRVYQEQPALYEKDFTSDGFAWVDIHNREESVIGFLRYGGHKEDVILAVCNFTPVTRHHYMIGAPCGGKWEEVLNSDAHYYGGSGIGNFGQIMAGPLSVQGYSNSLTLTLPPLAILVLKPVGAEGIL